METGWTLEELVRRVAHALADGDVRAANGRVTEVPDRRIVRWYATIGLVDRPLASQGRTARYGRRHLLQLVAIKRRQAEGHTLARIQAELAGATDTTLARVAGLDLASLADPAVADTPEPPPERSARAPSRSGSPPVAADRFWSRPLPPPLAMTATPHGAVREPDVVREPQAVRPPYTDAGTGLLHGVALGSAVLLLPSSPDAADVEAIRAAARPLIDLLVHRGLLPTPGGRTT